MKIFVGRSNTEGQVKKSGLIYEIIGEHFDCIGGNKSYRNSSIGDVFLEPSNRSEDIFDDSGGCGVIFCSRNESGAL